MDKDLGTQYPSPSKEEEREGLLSCPEKKKSRVFLLLEPMEKERISLLYWTKEEVLAM